MAENNKPPPPSHPNPNSPVNDDKKREITNGTHSFTQFPERSEESFSKAPPEKIDEKESKTVSIKSFFGLGSGPPPSIQGSSNQLANSKQTGDPLIPLSAQRNLADKVYDKRKLGASEIEKLIKEFLLAKDEEKIHQAIQYLVLNFVETEKPHSKKGGLIALAAASIALADDIPRFISVLAVPVIKCLYDQDPRVRYYACESLFNIAKVARRHVLIYFTEIFDALCKLAADQDSNVKNGSQLLDRLIKDLVTEEAAPDIKQFITLLQERVYVLNAQCRQFLINWILVLNSVPNIELLQYLPKFLDGIFNMLKDPTKDIRISAESCLNEFLKELKTKDPSQPDYAALVKILITHSSSKDEVTRLRALEWISEFLKFGKDHMVPFNSELCAAILPNISQEIEDIKEVAKTANNGLREIVFSTEKTVAVENLLGTILAQFSQGHATKIAALEWIVMLLEKPSLREPLERQLDKLFPPLLRLLSEDSSDEVIRSILKIVSMISQLNENYFTQFLQSLCGLFKSNRNLLEEKIQLIVKQFCVYMKPERIFISLAHLLRTEKNNEFRRLMIQYLNLILLTADELSHVRKNLRQMNTSGQEETRVFFTEIYKTWTWNAAATLSLCLLSELYEHASALVHEFSQIEMTLPFLLEIDKLVQLLESPIFLSLRLRLLQPKEYPHLMKCLYGILMILPQSSAYETLKNRLIPATTYGNLNLVENSVTTKEKSLKIDFNNLLKEFVQNQQKN